MKNSNVEKKSKVASRMKVKKEKTGAKIVKTKSLGKRGHGPFQI